VVGRKVAEIRLPKGATIGAIVRGLSAAESRVWSNNEEEKRSKDVPSDYDAQVLIAHHDTVIKAEDHIIVFVINKKLIRQVEKLFQVSVAFL
jgi:trk system potassium uptake protein TrkA